MNQFVIVIYVCGFLSVPFESKNLDQKASILFDKMCNDLPCDDPFVACYSSINQFNRNDILAFFCYAKKLID
jgi:hypothetical protein